MSAPTSAPPVPSNLRDLDRDKHDRIIPWFVHRDDDGTPDHRLPHKTAIRDAYRFRTCWLCGKPYGRWVVFPIGPMCAINRISGEPPSHYECAAYSAQVCPFLTTPSMRRRTTGMPDTKKVVGGFMAERNPGVIALWVTRNWHVTSEFNGHVFRLGEPSRVEWYTRGALADRDAASQALDSGLGFLRTYAEGPQELAELDEAYRAASHLLPTG